VEPNPEGWPNVLPPAAHGEALFPYVPAVPNAGVGRAVEEPKTGSWFVPPRALVDPKIGAWPPIGVEEAKAGLPNVAPPV
jgi:hypothetical protein